jgi:hypothetical protein
MRCHYRIINVDQRTTKRLLDKSYCRALALLTFSQRGASRPCRPVFCGSVAASTEQSVCLSSANCMPEFREACGLKRADEDVVQRVSSGSDPKPAVHHEHSEESAR